LWTLAGAWSAKHLTDGYIPEYVVEELSFTAKVASHLVTCGLWEVAEDGWRFKGWAKYQPTKEQVLERRHAEVDRKRKYRESRRSRDEVSQRDTSGTGTGQTVGHQRVSDYPDPTRPDPSRPQVNTSSSEPTARPDVEELCSLLADLIEGNASKRPTLTKAWRDAARLMLDRDERELDKTRNLIRWSQADGFWRKNILSMAKFRQRYDQLRLAALEDWEKRKPGAVSPDGEIDVDGILGRDIDGIGTPPEELWGDDEAEQEWRQQRRVERKAERLDEARRVLARRQGATV
jgi:hypothetical protein